MADEGILPSYFISDIHLGTKGTANQLCNFLKYNDCDQLYCFGTSLMSETEGLLATGDNQRSSLF